jgi:hypothetical protein
MGNKSPFRVKEDFTSIEKVATNFNNSEVLSLIHPETLIKPDISSDFDFDQLQYINGHIMLT